MKSKSAFGQAIGPQGANVCKMQPRTGLHHRAPLGSIAISTSTAKCVLCLHTARPHKAITLAAVVARTHDLRSMTIVSGRAKEGWPPFIFKVQAAERRKQLLTAAIQGFRRPGPGGEDAMTAWADPAGLAATTWSSGTI